MVFDYSFTDHPEGLALGIFIILFGVIFSVFGSRLKNKGMLFIIALAISGIAAWNLYTNEFYGWTDTLVFVLYLAVIALFLRMIWAFFRFNRKFLF